MDVDLYAQISLYHTRQSLPAQALVFYAAHVKIWEILKSTGCPSIFWVDVKKAKIRN